MTQFSKLKSETQSKLKQTFVAQVQFSSKPFFENLTLVPPYIKHEVWGKKTHLTVFEEMVSIILAQLMISGIGLC